MKLDLYQLNKRVEEGLLRKSQRGDLLLFVYTEKTEFEKLWDKYTLMCRGLVVDTEGNVVSKTLGKFFNLDQNVTTQLANLPNEPYVITEKADGSYISIWFHDGQWRASSKGSLDNEYIDFALTSLPDMSSVPINKVFACEVVLPRDLDGMRRAVDHEPGLYFITAFDKYQDFKELDWHKESKLWPGVLKVRHFSDTSIEQLVARQKSETGTEGWVIRFQSGLRVKIKTRHYLKIFAFINNLNPLSIKEFMLEYGLENERAWLEFFPEELVAEAALINQRLKTQFYCLLRTINAKFEELSWCFSNDCDNIRESRKAFALKAKDDPDSWALFNLFDKKDIKEKLLKKLEV